jgi:CDP-glucose 4,6-dehydratase
MNFWTDRPVFVTGATGLLGSHLTSELVARGANVTCLVRDSVSASHFHRLGLDRKVSIVRGELENYPLLERAIGEYEIETVFHLGAQTIVGIANKNPMSTWESNVRGSYHLMEACRRSPRVKRVLVASSDKAYGAQPKLPYDEDSPLIGRFPYDCSKSCTDLICTSYHVSFGLPVCITRCGNLFGAGDLNWNRIVPGTIRSALRGERPIIRSDGSFVRDYFFVEDAVHSYLLLAENMDRKDVVGQAFNFSDEKPLDVIAIANMVLEACGRPDLQLDVRGEATNEIPEQYLSSAKAKKLLDGWKPQWGIGEGLQKTVGWYRELLGATS